MIKSLEMLRVEHKRHLRKKLEEWFKSDTLERKLAERLALDAAETTGNAFWKLIDDLKKSNKMPNPYYLQIDEAKTLLVAAKNSLRSGIAQLQGLWFKEWKPTTFSSSLKQTYVVLSQNNSRART